MQFAECFSIGGFWRKTLTDTCTLLVGACVGEAVCSQAVKKPISPLQLAAAKSATSIRDFHHLPPPPEDQYVVFSTFSLGRNFSPPPSKAVKHLHSDVLTFFFLPFPTGSAWYSKSLARVGDSVSVKLKNCKRFICSGGKLVAPNGLQGRILVDF